MSTRCLNLPVLPASVSKTPSAPAIAKAHQTVRNLQWFTITETRGHVVEGKVAHWQVSLKIGFTLE